MTLRELLEDQGVVVDDVLAQEVGAEEITATRTVAVKATLDSGHSLCETTVTLEIRRIR